jgi:drug/metabolite transporter (DMT)-like permease
MNINLVLQMIYLVFAKYAMQNLKVDAMDLCIVRTGSLAVISCGYTYYYNKSMFRDIEPGQVKYLLARSLIGGCGYACMVFSVGNGPIVIWTLFVNTAPFWTSVLGFFILRETVSRFEILCIVGAFSGVFVLSFAKQSQVEDSVPDETQSHWFANTMALLNAVCYSCVIVLTR